MHDDERKRNRAKRERARRAKLRRRRLLRAVYAGTGALVLAAVVFFMLPFLRQSPAVAPLPETFAVEPVDAQGQPMYTPVPTPTPSPTPEPTPTPVPTPTPYPYAISGRTIDPDKKMVAITYDDGPSKKVTPEILKILKANDAVATFFMLGENAMAQPDIARAVAQAGHQIGTHTYDHKDLTKLSAAEVRKEVDDSIRTIENACGVRPAVLRPPYGAVNAKVKELIDMPLINWSVDTLDWKSRNAKKVYDRIAKDTLDGSVILMHDLYASTAEASKRAIPALIKAGYQLVTVDELFMYRGPELAANRLYLSANQAVK